MLAGVQETVTEVIVGGGVWVLLVELPPVQPNSRRQPVIAAKVADGNSILESPRQRIFFRKGYINEGDLQCVNPDSKVSA